MDNRVRIDKWLWAARFFKTRALASKACELGRIHSNSIQAKPAREVKVGDRLTIKNDSGDFEVDVLLLSEMRGPAAVAQTLYAETDASKAARAAAVEMRKTMGPVDIFETRPNKKDRRLLTRLRGRV